MASLLANSPLFVSIVVFACAAAVIGFFGIRMTHLARDVAAYTKLGEAFTGALFIGATNSLSGMMASGTAAWKGEASLAVSNSLGGIAAQTLFLVLGDFLYRKNNLEYAAASVGNLMMCAQLLLLMCILAIAFTLPQASFWSIHPASLVLLATYFFTMKLLIDAHDHPMWLPRMSRGTVQEGQSPAGAGRSIIVGKPLFLQFALCAVVVATAGWMMSAAGIVILRDTGLSAGIVGGLFIAVATSLPELVVAVTAIRMGALTLAVGDIVGGSAFDMLFVALADVLYRDGSIYVAIGQADKIWLGSTMLMTAVLLMGLLYRERKGIANIGLESVVILLVYVLTVAYLGFS
tara:strand:- start:96486 stop:97529 length:1044 start_codon:yes stop_codon:yes gene_type:complete